MRLTRAGIVYAVAAAIGIATLIWLLASPTDKDDYFRANVDLRCESPLSGEESDTGIGVDGFPFRRQDSYDVPAVCEKLRTRSLSWAVLVAIPTTVAAVLAVNRIQRTDPLRPRSSATSS
jgi:hypothetical protein